MYYKEIEGFVDWGIIRDLESYHAGKNQRTMSGSIKANKQSQVPEGFKP